MEDLKPCPFCGGTDLSVRHHDIDGWIAYIQCDRCDDVHGPDSEYKYDDKDEATEDAAKQWNCRAINEDAASLRMALMVLAQSHTRDDDIAGFTVSELRDRFRYSQHEYIEAWEAVRKHLHLPTSKAP